MKTLPLIALVLSVSMLPLLAEEKPASPSASAESKAAKSADARIAELETRVANLEKMLESLRKAAAGLPAIKIPNAPISRTGSPAGTRGPSDEDRKRYEGLSDAGKDKVRSYFRDHGDEMRKAGTDEERRAMVRAAFDKIAADDKPKKAD